MIAMLQTQRVQTLEQVRRIVEGDEAVDFTAPTGHRPVSASGALWCSSTTRYWARWKGTVKASLTKMPGRFRAQFTRLVAQHCDTGQICDRRGHGPARPFKRRYTAADVRLLAEVDAELGQRYGPATRAVTRAQ